MGRDRKRRVTWSSFGLRAICVGCCWVFLGWSFGGVVHAEDGYDLWLRYRPLSEQQARVYRRVVQTFVTETSTPTILAAQAELKRAVTGLLGQEARPVRYPASHGSIVMGTPNESSIVAGMHLDLSSLGPEGFVIRSTRYRNHNVTVIAANNDVGVLYGVFQFLRLMQTTQSISNLQIQSSPKIHRRILDHWDNLDGSVERGYAGGSIWDWFKLPEYLDSRYQDYARACASIGINGMVPNNVNASSVSLTTPYVEKAAALATVLRPYGVRIYLTARFTAPMEIGGLKTADPLDPAVRRWWRDKADEIYRLIPDFGGFLVKAHSEGAPGPQDYGRTHADGADMLAEALEPHGGIVMWRAFVYSDLRTDRVTQAYTEFVPLDGKFSGNVLIQVKNGPLDFQPREPFHPLFGAMPHTSVMMELQITKEYLGFATHLVYLGPLFEEVLNSDTFVRGEGSTVAKVVDGSLFHSADSGIAGVANIGTDRNWTGSHFDQANWYAFGRLAWEPTASSAQIATEWIRMTFSNDPSVVAPVLSMMMSSRENAVKYMTPLGLAHQMSLSHYGPAPWLTAEPQDSSTAVYFNQADANGIGFDRTVSGSNAVAQYSPPVRAEFGDLHKVPDSLLLWFRHLPWDYPMNSGRTLWEELVAQYTEGVQTVSTMRQTWARLEGKLDQERFEQVSAFLRIQEADARWWRDASVAYFQSQSRRPLPAGFGLPEHDLEYYESICIPIVPGQGDSPQPDCH
jgi:alpha-glucuronidase